MKLAILATVLAAAIPATTGTLRGRGLGPSKKDPNANFQVIRAKGEVTALGGDLTVGVNVKQIKPHDDKRTPFKGNGLVKYLYTVPNPDRSWQFKPEQVCVHGDYVVAWGYIEKLTPPDTYAGNADCDGAPIASVHITSSTIRVLCWDSEQDDSAAGLSKTASEICEEGTITGTATHTDPLDIHNPN